MRGWAWIRVLNKSAVSRFAWAILEKNIRKKDCIIFSYLYNSMFECSDEIVLVAAPFSQGCWLLLCVRVLSCALAFVCMCFRVHVRTSSRAFVWSLGPLSLVSILFLTSQVEGAFVQGLGLFTIEELRYSQSGAPWTTGPGAYKIPGFADIPVEFYVHLLRSAPNEKAVYSSKVRKCHKRSLDSTRRITCASLK